MKTSKYNKSEIMKQAHKLFRGNRRFGWSFSKCLTISWENAKARLANEEREAAEIAEEVAARNARYAANEEAARTEVYAISPSMASLYASGAYSGD